MDNWGIKTPTVTTVIPCVIKEAFEETYQHHSKFTDVQFVISSEGRINAKNGEEVVVYGKSYKIQKISYLKDLSGEVIATKLYV